jgi:hypothetical protein
LPTELAPIEQPLRVTASAWEKRLRATYGFGVAVSISLWLLAIRAPLWLDETGSWWQISAGFRGIWPRRIDSLCFPAYSYLLWLSTRVLGTSEIAMRIPSVLAMLGAMYLFYLAARELFEWDLAFIATILFALDPIVIAESLDVRPYAFGILATNAAILAVIRLRRVHSDWLAAFFGFASACIIWFHYLFGVIVPALVVAFLAVRAEEGRAKWRHLAIAAGVFVLAFLPVIPGLLYLFHTGQSHVFEQPPSLWDLVGTLAPGWVPLVFCLTVAVVVVQKFRAGSEEVVHFAGWQLVFCGSLALVSILILFGVSVATPIHMFVPRHRLVAVPGIALCWALLLTPFRSRKTRLLFCALLVAATTCTCLVLPGTRRHGYSWKYALQAAESHASKDNAPVLVCSDWPESDYKNMPSVPASSVLFAPLSYYRLTVPIVPLPRSLNNEAKEIGASFLQQASGRQERFLAMAFEPSYETLDWLSAKAGGSYAVHKLGVYDGVSLLEFDPLPKKPASLVSQVQ